jgi:hypothetical protein
MPARWEAGEERAVTDADEAKAKRKAQSERYTRIMWGYVCGGITLLSLLVGFGATFIPLGFGILGAILAWQLTRSGEQRHGLYVGAMTLGGVMIWLTYNWPMIHRLVG